MSKYNHVTTPEHVYAWSYCRNCLEPVEALQNQKSLACFVLVAKRIRGLRVAHLSCLAGLRIEIRALVFWESVA